MSRHAPIDPGEFRSLPLRAHELLDDVPLHDVWRVTLPDTGKPCSIPLVRTLLGVGTEQTDSPAGTATEGPGQSLPVRALFALRWALGRVFGWDEEPADTDDWSYRSRLTDEDIDRSTVATGTKDGPFTLLYVLENEALSEIRNSTVHAFLVTAVAPVSERTADGHYFYMAVYVKPVSGWTAAYMALIDPFRRWIVYPELLRRLERRWLQGP